MSVRSGAPLGLVSLTTTQRDALTPGSDVQIIWNSTNSRVEYYDGVSAWAGLGGGAPSRTTATYTTASLTALTGEETGTLTMAKTAKIIKIVTTRPARVRLYTTTAARDADVARARGVPPTVNTGLLLDFVTVTGVLTSPVAPPAIVDNQESSVTTAIAITVDNLDSSTGTVGVTFTYLAEES